ncbi:RES family NAD+ phosphorylase [Foetidibacter luteolus]|uniref:RES family NAD+ phosphorylase n=1 Tax=Foetidibacter luteolus TaxID=2608880 RepID=UPI00129B3D49|nr:RES family NAD+ phosphorylase [Foetidibacter luteolus]
MLAYRIVHKNYSSSLFASGLKGRWNTDGRKVIYTAESIALAFLENMVRRQGVGFNRDFRIMFINIPAEASVNEISVEDLPEGWRDFHDYSKCQPLGDKWYDEKKALILKVPSAVLPEAFNFIINTTHADFSGIELIDSTDLVPDERIEVILKNYR